MRRAVFCPQFQNQNSGQTLIEILIALSVIVTLSSLLVLYTRTGALQSNLFRSVDQLALNTRRAQDLALLSQESSPGQVPCGYGVHFAEGATEYYIFADLASPLGCSGADGVRNPNGSEDVEKIKLETGVEILSTTASDIVFRPPSPETVITPNANEAVISLSLLGQSSLVRQVKVTKAGQITIVAP